MKVKRGFTLVEMMIVLVVLVTLMSIVFRLSTVVNGSTERATTISRMQRLENCLSGYYAALGSYPPVKVHGSRNIYLETNGRGEQDTGNTNSKLNWSQVEAACRAQPVACEFPFEDEERAGVEAIGAECKKLAKSGDGEWKGLDSETINMFTSGSGDSPFTTSGEVMSQLASYQDEISWEDIQLYKFGMMSYLVPRFTVMMSDRKETDLDGNNWTGQHNSQNNLFNGFKQWYGNNAYPHDPETGEEVKDWDEVRGWSSQKRRSVPSQVICGRWIKNLENMCCCNFETWIFGVKVSDGYNPYNLLPSPSIKMSIHRPGGYGEKNYDFQYVLNGMTVRDGWGLDFYYYSQPPYQNYVLWSSGANKKTFPPWIDRSTLQTEDRKTAGEWVADDITHLSN